MGAWSVSITGNDTAEDLKSEYQAAFFYYDIETALSKIDKYVRAVGFDESDEEEWCNYYYSLADFMWRKGILTDSIRDKAVQMIDSEFEENGITTVEEIEMLFRAYDSDDWMADDFVNENIVIQP